MRFSKFLHGPVCENLPGPLKKDPKKSTIAKFENDLDKKDEEIALQTVANVSAGVWVMGSTKLHTPTQRTDGNFLKVFYCFQSEKTIR